MADTIKQFAKLYASLVQEKKDLENRLVDINKALAGDLKAPKKAASKNGRKNKSAPKNGGNKSAGKKKAAPKNGRKNKKAATKKTSPKKKAKKKTVKRAKNKTSLRLTIVSVLGKKHLGKKEILAAVQKAGYKFSTKDPMNSLQVQLYTKFKRDKDGKFHV